MSPLDATNIVKKITTGNDEENMPITPQEKEVLAKLLKRL
jgi:hypothetical protein